MDDLVTWLRAQLDEERSHILKVTRLEASSWEAIGTKYLAKLTDDDGTPIFGDAAFIETVRHIARWDPARVLVEVDAKRKILERPGPVCNCDGYDPPMNPDTNWTTPLPHHFDCASYETAKLLALPYADRPGYSEEWRP